MIRLNDEYVITADTYGYALCKDKGDVDKKSGKTTYRPIAYTTTITSAINSMRTREIRKAFSTDEEMSLSEAIDVIERENKKFINLLKSVIEDKENISNE